MGNITRRKLLVNITALSLATLLPLELLQNVATAAEHHLIATPAGNTPFLFDTENYQTYKIQNRRVAWESCVQQRQKSVC